MLVTLVVPAILAAVGLTSAATPQIGKCNVSKLEVINVDFSEFASSNGGLWRFLEVVNTETNSKLSLMKLTLKPSTTKGSYDVMATYLDKQNENGTLTSATATASNSGPVILKGKDYSLKLYFLKYVKDSLAYFYLCADDGDGDVDFRFVVGKDVLKAEDKIAIASLDKAAGFKGTLIDL